MHPTPGRLVLGVATATLLAALLAACTDASADEPTTPTPSPSPTQTANPTPGQPGLTTPADEPPAPGGGRPV